MPHNSGRAYTGARTHSSSIGALMVHRLTVRQLAAEAGRDSEEVLLVLWDEGLDYIEDVDEYVRTNDVSRCRTVLGSPSPKQRRRLGFWAEHLEMTRAELLEYLQQIGVRPNPNARNLPKGGLKKLERAIREDTSKSRTFAKNAGLGAQRELDETPHDETDVPQTSFEGVTVGRERDIDYLHVSEVEDVHFRLVLDAAQSYDPIDPPGPRDRGLLEMAATRPKTSLGDALKYPTLEMASGALLHSLILNHPFHNGNKRTALVSMLCFLDRNNVVLTCSEGELFQFVLKVAQRRLVPARAERKADREVIAIAEWIRTNSRPIDKSDRPLKWRELKSILRRYGCTYQERSGNRLNISRRMTVRGGLLHRAKVEELKYQATYPDDGREVPRGELHRVRRSLWLDEEHGVDSSAFYGEESNIDDFIAEYRKVLRRLAKL